ncbi:hypothetical protein JCM3774_006492 [Rhodotorula dairenensis]
MCIVFFTASQHYSLIVASNRDEFLARPTSTAKWHAWDPHTATETITERNRVLSGLDLTAGGTWFGISLSPASATATASRMHFATLTNYTETVDATATPKPSRGNLVRDYLDVLADSESQPATRRDRLQAYLDRIEHDKQLYAGFNLLVGEIDTLGDVRLGYTSNRESPTKRARVLPSLDPLPRSSSSSSSSAPEDDDPSPDAPSPHVKVHVRGLSNATLEVEPGENEWPKVKSGAAAVEQVVSRFEASQLTDPAQREEQLAKGLYHALSTAHPSPIRYREHLRETVLVEPVYLDPSRPLQAVPPPFPPPHPPPSPSLSVSGEAAHQHENKDENEVAPPAPSILPPSAAERMNDSPTPVTAANNSSNDDSNGGRSTAGHLNWYATRVQTLLLVERKPGGKVIFRERDAYVLDDDDDDDGAGWNGRGTGTRSTTSRKKPKWSGQERRYEIRL